LNAVVLLSFACWNTLLRLVVAAIVYVWFKGVFLYEAAGGCVGALFFFIAYHIRVQRGERRRGTGRNCDGDEEEHGFFRHVDVLCGRGEAAAL
jgi:hypothetical protein